MRVEERFAVRSKSAMKRPDLRWRQQRECEDNETANFNGIEIGLIIVILALLSGGLIVSLDGNHQRKEAKNDATGIKHQEPMVLGELIEFGPCVSAETTLAYALIGLHMMAEEKAFRSSSVSTPDSGEMWVCVCPESPVWSSNGFEWAGSEGASSSEYSGAQRRKSRY